MRWIIGGFVGLVGIAALIKKIKDKKAERKTEADYVAELVDMNRQLDELVKQAERLEKQEREVRQLNNELMKELVMMMKEGNPDIIIV